MKRRETVLIVEDDFLIALDTEDMLRAAGYEDIVVEASPEPAMQAIARKPPDFAILDFNLKSETSAGLARHLQSRNVPFLFVTGKDQRSFPEDLCDAPTLGKPLVWEDVAAWIESVTSGAANVG